MSAVDVWVGRNVPQVWLEFSPFNDPQNEPPVIVPEYRGNALISTPFTERKNLRSAF